MKSEFHKTIKQLARRHHTWQVFADFCEMAAVALCNAVAMDAAREHWDGRKIE